MCMLLKTLWTCVKAEKGCQNAVTQQPLVESVRKAVQSFAVLKRSGADRFLWCCNFLFCCQFFFFFFFGQLSSILSLHTCCISCSCFPSLYKMCNLNVFKDFFHVTYMHTWKNAKASSASRVKLHIIHLLFIVQCFHCVLTRIWKCWNLSGFCLITFAPN